MNVLENLLGVLNAFTGLSALAGGVAILAGWEHFPAQWLKGTPFKSYTFPAIVLALLVGGTTLMASYLIFNQHIDAMIWSMVSGIMLAGFIAVEIIVLDPEHPGASPLEVFYLLLGIAIFTISLILFINPDYSS